jgi:soluble lytic murein transglycosylase
VGTTPIQEYASLFLAQSLLKTGDFAGARGAAVRAVDGAPEGRPMPSVLLQAAAVLSSAGDDATAAGLYQRFLERYPDHTDSRARSVCPGTEPARRGSPARGLTRLRRAVAAVAIVAARRRCRASAPGDRRGGPRRPRAHAEGAHRARGAPARRGGGESARSEAEALLDAKLPADLAARALKIVADAARRAGRVDAATATVNRALVSCPPIAARRGSSISRGFSRRRALTSRSRRSTSSCASIRRARRPAEGLGLKARTLESAGRVPDAEAVYQKLAADYPDQEEGGSALWRLGWLSWFRGAQAEAAARWGRLAAVRGGQAHREAAAYWIGRAHEQRGEGDAAARQFAQVQADGPRTYYGILASRRAAAPPRAAGVALTLPTDGKELLEADPRFARAEALRAVGLAVFADEEMDELTRRSLGEPKRLYALSSVYAQESRHHLALRILRRHFQPYARSGLASLPRAFWEMYYPLGWRAELTEAAGRAIIDPLLVAAVVREESSFYPQARSRVGARGLMQLMPDTARPMAQARRLPFNNGDLLDDPGRQSRHGLGIPVGSPPGVRRRAARRRRVQCRSQPACASGGGGRRSDDLEVWVEQIPFNETRAFVKRVMLSWDEYRRLYGAASSAEPPPVLVPHCRQTVTDLTTAGFWRRGAAAASTGRSVPSCGSGARCASWSAYGASVPPPSSSRTRPSCLPLSWHSASSCTSVYHVAFVGGCGQTPGRMALGIAVVRRDGGGPAMAARLLGCLGGCVSIVTLGPRRPRHARHARSGEGAR